LHYKASAKPLILQTFFSRCVYADKQRKAMAKEKQAE
jgi:hypothetical protein